MHLHLCPSQQVHLRRPSQHLHLRPSQQVHLRPSQHLHLRPSHRLQLRIQVQPHLQMPEIVHLVAAACPSPPAHFEIPRPPERLSLSLDSKMPPDRLCPGQIL